MPGYFFARNISALVAIVAFTVCSLFGLAKPTMAQVQTVVEYGLTTVWEYGGYFSYFVTSFPDEIAALDSGALNGCCGYIWQRTGDTFGVWNSPVEDAVQTCRFFYATMAVSNNVVSLDLDHFYTPYAGECAAVQAHPDWRYQYEGTAFYLKVPDESGNCPTGATILYRLYNNGLNGMHSHRLTTSAATLSEMRAAGWVFEGDSRTFAFACVPVANALHD